MQQSHEDVNSLCRQLTIPNAQRLIVQRVKFAKGTVVTEKPPSNLVYRARIQNAQPEEMFTQRPHVMIIWTSV